jgi:glycosyltransferase involved in cell wall biosynthesis
MVELFETTAARSSLRTPGSAEQAPLVSVVVPTYNRAARVARAICSVQRQTHTRLEIIVVDDASHDDTPQVVANLHDPRLRYIRHNKNAGGSAARNTGIRAASGEFIAFLDDDDEWEPEKTEEQLKVLQYYDVVVCTSDGIGPDLHKYEHRKALELADLRTGPFGGTGVLMARTAVLKETLFDEALPRGQDWDVFIRIAMKHRIGYLNKPLLRYDNGDHDRITNRIREISIDELERQLQVVHKHQPLFGMHWFRLHMAHGLLYGLSRRPDKLALLVYTGRHYGWTNVGRVLLARLGARWRESLTGPAPARSEAGTNADTEGRKQRELNA